MNWTLHGCFLSSLKLSLTYFITSFAVRSSSFLTMNALTSCPSPLSPPYRNPAATPIIAASFILGWIISNDSISAGDIPVIAVKHFYYFFFTINYKKLTIFIHIRYITCEKESFIILCIFICNIIILITLSYIRTFY